MNIQQIKEIQSTVDLFSSALFKYERMISMNNVNSETDNELVNTGTELFNILTDVLQVLPSMIIKTHEKKLLELICNAFDTTFDNLFKFRYMRNPEFVIPRQIHMTCLNLYFGYSLSDAGKIYEKRSLYGNALKKCSL